MPPRSLRACKPCRASVKPNKKRRAGRQTGPWAGGSGARIGSFFASGGYADKNSACIEIFPFGARLIIRFHAGAVQSRKHCARNHAYAPGTGEPFWLLDSKDAKSRITRTWYDDGVH